MIFTVSIDVSNATFDDHEELGRILRELANRVDRDGAMLGETGSLRDVNGNTVGGWQLQPEVTP
jgi:hypothetical protein